jgi:hypothetical protein
VSDSFNVANVYPVAGFPQWSAEPGVERLAGDYNGDGKTDIALTGAAWASVPVALSNGDGSFTIVNSLLSDFPTWSSTAGVQRFAADFNRDGRTDIALTGPAWASVPVALSNGDGTFTVVNGSQPNFASWSATSGTERILGDFNGDGRADIALLNSVWGSKPIAMGNADGTFTVTNVEQSLYYWGPFWNWGYPTPNLRHVPCDYNGDGKTDIWVDPTGINGPAAYTGLNGPSTYYAMFPSLGDGSFDYRIPTRTTIVGVDTQDFDNWTALAATTVVSNFGGH